MLKCLQKHKRVIQFIHNSENGQTIAEYSTMVVLLVGVTLVLITLLRAFSSYGWRILNLVGSDYP